MFQKKANRYLPKHIEYYTYHRDKNVRNMPKEDMLAIEDFYSKHRIRYKNLTTYQQVIIFKRTINYIYIVAHFFDKSPNNPMKAKFGPDKDFGVARTQAYIFYKDGKLLYELDHDYQKYPFRDTTQVESKKLLKVNYELHDLLNNPYLKKIGRYSKSISGFDKAAHDLLKNDDILPSIDFIKDNN